MHIIELITSLDLKKQDSIKNEKNNNNHSIRSACNKLPGSKKTKITLKESLQKGKIVFEQNCLTCHQADGGGVPNLNPPLIKTSFVLGDKKKLIGIILNGLSDTEIDGESYSNPMPAFNFLSDSEIANVLTYIRNSFTNKSTAVTEEEVKALR